MPLPQAVAVIAAGLAAGTINTVVGSGTLITFPVLVLLGVPPVSANMSNSLGLCAAALTGIPGLRHHLADVHHLVRRFLPLTLLGAGCGALLLLVLPAQAFQVIVPALIAIALVLVVLGPALNRRIGAAHDDQPGGERHLVLTSLAAFGTAVYGGYFGAAQGIILISLLGLLLPHPLPQLNALKVVLTSITNLVASVVFVVVAADRMRWDIAGLVAVGALAGGWLGARIGSRVSPGLLRALIVAVGVVAIVRMLA